MIELTTWTMILGAHNKVTKVLDVYTSISASLHCWGRLNCTTSWSKNVSGLMLLANPGTNTVFHNAGFSMALLRILHALKPSCNCMISGMDPCRRYFMQMGLQINMIYLLIQSTSINYQKANATTAGNYSSLNSWVDTIHFYFNCCC